MTFCNQEEYAYLLDVPDKPDPTTTTKDAPANAKTDAVLSREERMTKILQGDASEVEGSAPQSMGFADGFNKTARNTDKNASKTNISKCTSISPFIW